MGQHADIELQKASDPTETGYDGKVVMKRDGNDDVQLTSIPSAKTGYILDASGQKILTIDEATGDLVSTRFDNGALGPGHKFLLDSASPAVDDVLGYHRFRGRNDAGAIIDFAEMQAIVKSVTAGAEEAWFRFKLMNGGTLDADAFEVRIVGGEPKLYVGGVEVSGSGGGAASAALVHRSTFAVIPNNSWTAPGFDVVDRDDGGFYDAGSSTIFTIPTTGWHVLSHSLMWNHNAAGARAVRFILDGSTELPGRVWSQDSSGRGMGGSTPARYFTAGDEIEMQVFQTSGGNLNLSGSAGEQAHFGIHKV